MDDDLVRRWNARVAPQDTIYHLGDVAFGSPSRWSQTGGLELNGRKILIRSNHDRNPGRLLAAGFREVHENAIVAIDGVRVWMNHYPCDPKDRRTRLVRPTAPGTFDLALSGHVHNLWKAREGSVNVGVDVWEFAPVTLDQTREEHERARA